MPGRIHSSLFLFTKPVRAIKGLLCVCIAAAVVLPAAPASSLDHTLFGPKRYVRHKGNPTEYRDTFKGCASNGQAVLRVTNGTSDGTRITSAEIVVNGARAAAENDFKKQTASFEKIIHVRETNTILVRLKSGRQDDYDADGHDGYYYDDRDDDRDEYGQPKHPASFIIVEVVGQGCVSADPPVISKPTPTDGSLLNNTMPVISAQYAPAPNGSGIDLAGVLLTVDGTDVTVFSAVTPTGIAYTPAVSLPEGIHAVTLSLSDIRQNSSSLSWHFTTDTFAPAVKIASHQNNQYLNTPIISVSGAVSDPAAAITVNGNPAQVSGSTFTYTGLVLSEGPNTITVSAVDKANNTGTDSIVVNLDTVAPVITITTPQDSAFVNTPSVTVAGTSNEFLTSVLANNARGLISDMTFSVSGVPLTEGLNTVTVTGLDEAGNPGTATVSVTLDTAAPVVAITSPVNGILLNSSQVSVSGTVSEPETTVMVNNIPAVVTGQSFLLSGLVLAQGENTVTVAATDNAGNPAATTVVVIVDSIAPAPPIFSPQPSPTRTETISLSGTAEALAGVTVYSEQGAVAGIAVADAQGNFNLPGVTLLEGTNTFTATATDAAGNTSGPSTLLLVLLDRVSPVVTIATPAVDAYLNTPTITITGFVSEPVSSVSVNGIPATVQGTGFSLPGFALSEGRNTISVLASDAAGNPGTAVAEVTLDTKAPVISVGSPANNFFSSVRDITLSGSLDEAAMLTVNGSPVTLNENNTFSHLVTLQSGTNTFSFSATDTAGNTSDLTWFVELDSTPLVVTIAAPVSGQEVNTPAITVSGTISKVLSTVTVNGIPAQVSGLDFSLSGFALKEDLNVLTVEATDRAGNKGTAEARITLDTQGPALALQAPGEAAAGATVTLGVNATDRSGVALAELLIDGMPFWSSLFNSDSSAGSSVLYSLSPDLAPGTVIDIQARGKDVLGNEGTKIARIVVTQGPSGPGYIQGEVYDDSRGLRLEGAEVRIISTTTGRALTSITTGQDGGYFTETGADTCIVSVSKTGYLPVERVVTIKPEKKSIAIDARLTPVSTVQNPVDAAGMSLLVPASSGNSPASIALDLPADAVAQQTDLRVTAVGNQGLANLLPSGWSPIGIVDIRSFAVDGTEVAEGTRFGSTATLRLPIITGLDPASPPSVAFIRYEKGSHLWIVQGQGTMSSDRAFITAAVSSTGQYALVLPDDAACFATAASAITPCGSNPNSDQITPETISASGRVVPVAAPPSAGLKALGRIVLSPVVALTTGSLNSGLLINARVAERFDLLSGDPVVPSDYVQDLILYRSPCVTGPTLTTAPESLGAGSVSAAFPVSPSRDYTIADLMLGKVTISVNLPEVEPAGTLIGATGGRVLDAGGNVLTIPDGALGQTTPVQTKTVEASAVSGIAGGDFTVLRVVDLNLTHQALSVSAELSIPTPAGFDPTLPVVVAKAITVKGVQKLKLVALGRLSGSLITSSSNSLNGLDGILASGMYFFLQSRAPLGFVAGTVTSVSGAPAASAYVTSSTCSLVDLTNAAGAYLVAAKVSTFDATATDLVKNDRGTSSSSIASPNQVVYLNLAIKITPPSVISLSPGDGAVKVDPNTALVITFSEPMSRPTISTDTITLRDNSGTTIACQFSVNGDGTVVTLYPSGVFKSEGAYTLTVSKAVKDLQGYSMVQDATATFTIKDTIPPLPPAGGITGSFPDANGYVTVTSTQGSVEPNCAVMIINDNTGEIVTVMSQSNGSFTGRIRAMLGDEIRIVLLDASGNQTLVSYITFKSGDGRYLVTARGGVVEGEGDTRLVIPEGALVSPTVVKITQVAEDQLPHAVPQGGRYLAAVNIDTGGFPFQKAVEISVRAPSGVKTEDMPFVAQPQDLTNPDGTIEKVYSVVDSAKVENGRLSSACEPFPGVLGIGLFVFTFPTAYPAVVSGYTYWDKDGQGGYNPQYDANGGFLPNSDRPIKNAIIRSLGGFQYISYSNASGRYAIYGMTDMEFTGDCRTLKMTAINPMTAFRKNIDVPLCKQDPLKLDFKLADAATQVPDVTSPSIEMNLQVAPNSDQDAAHQDMRFTAGTIPVGTNIKVPVNVIDQQIATATISVSFKTPDMPAAQSYNAQLNPTGSSIYTYVTPDNPVAILKYTYDGVFGAPVSSNGYFRPDTAGTYTIEVVAVDAAGHQSVRSMTMRAVLAGTQPDGIDGPPTVDEIIPSDGAKNVMVTMPITVTFSEAVNIASVNDATFQLIELSSGMTVSASRYTSIEGGRMQAVLVPNNNLMFGKYYKVIVTQGIRDDVPNPSAPPGAPYYNLDKDYTAIFRTKDPEVFDLQGGQFTGGKDIALYTHPTNGQTYAYIAAMNQGWYATDVTDPTNPFITHKENWNVGGGLIFNYRGVGVDQGNSILGVAEWIQGTNEWTPSAGYVRFYNLLITPGNPLPVIGQDRIAEGSAGVPDRIAISGNYAYVSTLMVGLLVIDIQKSQAAHQYGDTVVGTLYTVDLDQCPQPNSAMNKCGNPSDLALYKGNRLLMPTFSGHLVTIDASEPTLPNILSAYKPLDFSAWRVAIAEAYAYTDSTGQAKVMDVAVVSSQLAQSRIYTVDVSDGYNPVRIGVLKDSNGNEVQVMANEVTVNKNSGLAYASTGASVYVIDIKDPYNPLLLNIITQAPDSTGGVISLGGSAGLVEKDGWVYLASQQNGMRVLDLDPVYLKHYCDDSEFSKLAGIFCKSGIEEYYPGLGEKIIRLQGFNANNMPLLPPAKIKFVSSIPSAGVLVSSKEVDTTRATVYSDGTGFFYVKYVQPNIQGPQVNSVILNFEIDLASLPSSGNQLQSTQDNSYRRSIVLNVRDNSNVTLDQVLAGKAVFVRDDGKSIGLSASSVVNDKDRKLSFVQEMLNMVVARKRNVSSYNFILENGVYGATTEQAVKSFRQKFGSSTGLNANGDRIGNARVNFGPSGGAIDYATYNPNGTGQPVNDNTTDMFRKLMKDYNHRTVAESTLYLHKIIDKETLIGAEKSNWFNVLTSTVDSQPNDQSTNSRKDTGLYELYNYAVLPYIDQMIKEAERFAGKSDNNIYPTSNWYSRNGVGPQGDPIKPDYSSRGMSYSFGGKMSIEQYNSTTQVLPICYVEDSATLYVIQPDFMGVNGFTIPLAQGGMTEQSPIVDASYRGDLLLNPVALNEDGSPICQTGSGQSFYKYPGLRKHEQTSTNQYGNIIAYYSGKNGQIINADPPSNTTQLLQYLPERWAGIDCSGLTQRALNKADQSNIAGTTSKLDDLGQGSCPVGSSGCLACGSQNYAPTYARTIYDANISANTQVDMQKLVRRGDLVIYATHVAIEHSDRMVCGDDGCTFNIIHASGSDDICYQGSDGAECYFNRKVVLNTINSKLSNQTLKKPKKFARIKIWD